MQACGKQWPLILCLVLLAGGMSCDAAITFEIDSDYWFWDDLAGSPPRTFRWFRYKMDEDEELPGSTIFTNDEIFPEMHSPDPMCYGVNTAQYAYIDVPPGETSSSGFFENLWSCQYSFTRNGLTRSYGADGNNVWNPVRKYTFTETARYHILIQVKNSNFGVFQVFAEGPNPANFTEYLRVDPNNGVPWENYILTVDAIAGQNLTIIHYSHTGYDSGPTIVQQSRASIWKESGDLRLSLTNSLYGWLNDTEGWEYFNENGETLIVRQDLVATSMDGNPDCTFYPSVARSGLSETPVLRWSNVCPLTRDFTISVTVQWLAAGKWCTDYFKSFGNRPCDTFLLSMRNSTGGILVAQNISQPTEEGNIFYARSNYGEQITFNSTVNLAQSEYVEIFFNRTRNHHEHLPLAYVAHVAVASLVDSDSDGRDDCSIHFDRDGDGIPNSEECEDEDSDCVCDLVDTIPELYNPLQNDYDSDGMACPDNCPFISNADQLDSDGDGEGDVCDPCPFEADDENDQDGDDIPDNCDPVRYLCASAPPSEFGPIPCNNPDTMTQCAGDNATGDADSDAVCDNYDRCPDNDDLMDIDADKIPDACDPCAAENIFFGHDQDLDGFCNDVDICANDFHQSDIVSPCNCGEDTRDIDHDGVVDCADYDRVLLSHDVSLEDGFEAVHSCFSRARHMFSSENQPLLIVGKDEDSNVLASLYSGDASGLGSSIFDFASFSGMDIYDAAWADVDRSGLEGLVVIGRDRSSGDKELRIYHVESNGQPSGGVETLWSDSSSQEETDRMRVADMDLNGYPDIVIVGQESADESPYFRIYFNENGTFTVEDHSEGPVPLDGDLELADIDADGFPEIIVGGYDSGKDDRYTLVLSRSAEGQLLVVDTLIGCAKGDLLLLDYDHDGFLDILASGEDSRGLDKAVRTAIYLNVPGLNENSRRFAQMWFFIPPALFGAAVGGDLNGDGADDIVISGLRDGQPASSLMVNDRHKQYIFETRASALLSNLWRSCIIPFDNTLYVSGMDEGGSVIARAYRISTNYEQLKTVGRLDWSYDCADEILSLSWEPAQDLDGAPAALFDVRIHKGPSTISLWQISAAAIHVTDIAPDHNMTVMVRTSTLIRSSEWAVTTISASSLCPCAFDGDSDGVCDSLPDNCPSVCNPDQMDVDEDGLGDACDADVDGDGVDNHLDVCPNGPDVVGCEPFMLSQTISLPNIRSMAMKGDVLLVGYEDVSSAVEIFINVMGTWEETVQDPLSPPPSWMSPGYAASLSTDAQYVAVADGEINNAFPGSGKGAAYIYRRFNSTFSLQEVFVPSQLQEDSISSTRVASRKGLLAWSFGSNVVDVYEESASSTLHVFVQTLSGPGPVDQLLLTQSRDIVLCSSGSAKCDVFDYGAEDGVFKHLQTLSSVPNSLFGRSLSSFGRKLLLIGAPSQDTCQRADDGTLFLFERSDIGGIYELFQRIDVPAYLVNSTAPTSLGRSCVIIDPFTIAATLQNPSSLVVFSRPTLNERFELAYHFPLNPTTEDSVVLLSSNGEFLSASHDSITSIWAKQGSAADMSSFDVPCYREHSSALPSELDSDFDGICDDVDSCPMDSKNDEDADGVCGDVDPCPEDANDDTDFDGVCDAVDYCPNDPAKSGPMVCGCNQVDSDSNSDGQPDCVDECNEYPDPDSDGLCGSADSCSSEVNTDTDSDGLCDADDSCVLDPENDADGDGICGSCEADADSDGTADCQQVISFEAVAEGHAQAGGWFEGVDAQRLAVLDYDVDGFMDILFVGNTTRLYRNLGPSFDHRFEHIEDVVLPNLVNPSVAVGDFDNDGYIDIVLSGRSVSEDRLYTLTYRNTAREEEDPNFVLLNFICTSNFPEVEYGSIDVADLNQDGFSDVLVCGSLADGTSVARVYLNVESVEEERVFRQVKKVFLPGALHRCQFVDINGDSHKDIFLSGALTLEEEDIQDQVIITKVFLHLGSTARVDFIESEPLSSSLTPLWGWSDFGDFDNDGDEDLVHKGIDGGGNPATNVYQNDGDTFVRVAVTSLQQTSDGSILLCDFDGDDYQDLLSNSHQGTQLFRVNQNGPRFDQQLAPNLPNVSGQAACLDFDYDGDVDIAFLSGEEFLLFENMHITDARKRSFVAFAPLPPESLSVDLDIPNGVVTFSWDPPAGAAFTSSLSYDLAVGLASEAVPISIFAPQADLSTGTRTTTASAPISVTSVISRPTLILRNVIQVGIAYKWSVQTVDHRNVGSVFAPSVEFQFEDADFDQFTDSIQDLCPNDREKQAPGLCGCGKADIDSDSDGSLDCNEECPLDPNKVEVGSCGCGEVDDVNGNGLPDCLEDLIPTGFLICMEICSESSMSQWHFDPFIWNDNASTWEGGSYFWCTC